MITPLDIENKKFSKKVKGYDVDEVDDFLDDLTEDYEKIYKEASEAREKIATLESQLERYQGLEDTLQNTLIMAQTTAEEAKKVAMDQAEQIVKTAQNDAKSAVDELNQEILLKKKELDDLQKEFDVYKAKMESLLISQLELLKEVNNDD